jgi:capsular polysaccharide biosynthesis protein
MYFKSIGFSIINPELIAFTFLTQLINAADDVAVYWGSAMTNLIYCKWHTRVFVLQSKSYSDEKIEFWSKLINNYHLQVVVINEVNSSIPISEIEKKLI